MLPPDAKDTTSTSSSSDEAAGSACSKGAEPRNEDAQDVEATLAGGSTGDGDKMLPQDTQDTYSDGVVDDYYGSKRAGTKDKGVRFEAGDMRRAQWEERPAQSNQNEVEHVPAIDISEHSLELADILRDRSHTPQHSPEKGQVGAPAGDGSDSSLSIGLDEIVAPNKQYSTRSMISELSDGDHDDEHSDNEGPQTSGFPNSALRRPGSLRKRIDSSDTLLRRSHQSDSGLGEAGEFTPGTPGKRRPATKRNAVARQADGNLEATLHSSLTMNFNLADLRDSLVKRRPTGEGDAPFGLSRRSSIDSTFGISGRRTRQASDGDRRQTTDGEAPLGLSRRSSDSIFGISGRRTSSSSRRDSTSGSMRESFTGKGKRTIVESDVIEEVGESQTKNLDGDVSSDESADEFRDSFTFNSAESFVAENESTEHQQPPPPPQSSPGFGTYIHDFTRRKFRANGATPIQMIENQFFIPPPDEGQTFVQSLSYTIQGYGNEFVIYIYQAPFFTVLFMCLIFYFSTVFAFAGILLAFENHSEGRCTSPAYGMFTRGELYELAFELSWTTFTTTGYGIMSPSGSNSGCYGIRFACSMFAFMGLLFNRCGTGTVMLPF